MSNEKLKVLIVVGTRPEIIRLSSVIKLVDKHCNLYLAHTGQNYDYELNEIFFKDLQIRKPDIYLNCGDPKKGASEIIGNIIIEVSKVLTKVSPDCVLILGDTNSCMAAIPARRNKIPVFHMEAGNRCFDDRVPEEINRRLVDHISDVNLTYSSISRDYLLREGFAPDRVIKTGSPMLEVLDAQSSKIEKSTILKKLKLEDRSYFVISLHREENIDSEKIFLKITSIITEIAKTYKLPIIFSTHPRTRNRIKNSGINFPSEVKLMKPLGFSDYIKLQVHSKAVLSDSGTINEESSILNFPALNLREAFERPEAMEEGSVMMVGFNQNNVINALQILESQGRGTKRSLKIVGDYNVDNVSEKVLRILHSYTSYINRTVWKKY